MSILDTEFRVIDVETTGLDKQNDRIVEVAVVGKTVFDLLVNPGIPIPVETSGVHHITDRDVAKAPSIAEVFALLDAEIPKNCVIVAHNAKFDRAFLSCLHDRRWLCSQRLAMHLYPDAPSFKNQVLRYALLDERQQDALKKELGSLAPHRAKADALVTKSITAVLLHRYLLRHEQYPDQYPDDIDALIALADSPIIVRRMPIGEHRNKPIAEVPSDYLAWGLRKMANIDPDLKYTFQEELRLRGVTV